MRHARWAIAIIGALVVAGQVEAFSAAYDQHMTMATGEVVDAKVKVKDKLFRMEMTVQGMRSVVIRNESGTYQILPDMQMAMKMTGLGAAQNPLDQPEDYDAYLRRHNGRVLRSETIRGYACTVYEFDDPTTGGTSHAWMWKEQPFPVRLEQHGPQGTSVVEVSNIKIGVAIADSEFRLPPGVQVSNMGDMMGIGNIMEQIKGE